MSWFNSKIFITFKGEIVGIDPPMKGYVPSLSHPLFGTFLNGTIMVKRIDYVKGEVVNGSVYIKETGPYINPNTGQKIRKAYFVCKYCGSEFVSHIASIKRGVVVSCGCYHNRRITEALTTHGLSSHRLYSTWRSMIARCVKLYHPNYHRYGGRGISVHKNWIEDFAFFIAYVSTLPNYGKTGYTLDRINPDGNYEPGNLRWANQNTQMRNSSHVKSRTGYRGVTTCRNRFQAYLNTGDRHHHIGTYNTALEAAIARDKYITKHNIEGFNLQVL